MPCKQFKERWFEKMLSQANKIYIMFYITNKCYHHHSFIRANKFCKLHSVDSGLFFISGLGSLCRDQGVAVLKGQILISHQSKFRAALLSSLELFQVVLLWLKADFDSEPIEMKPMSI